MLLAVIADQPAFAVEYRLDMHRPVPNLLNVAHRVARMIQLQLHALVAMAQVQLSSVGMIRFRHINEWLARIREAGKKLLLYVFELAAGDFVHAALAIKFVGKQFMLLAEFFGKE